MKSIAAGSGMARSRSAVKTTAPFKTREEAGQMAERVRQERSLTAFVTPR